MKKKSKYEILKYEVRLISNTFSFSISRTETEKNHVFVVVCPWIVIQTWAILYVRRLRLRLKILQCEKVVGIVQVTFSWN